VFVSSMAQLFYDVDVTNSTMKELCDFGNSYPKAVPDSPEMDGTFLRPYSRSKLQQAMQARTLASESEGHGKVYAYSLHPGCVATPMAYSGAISILKLFGYPEFVLESSLYGSYLQWWTDRLWRSPWAGAQDAILLSLKKKPFQQNGAFVHSLIAKEANPHADNQEALDRLASCTKEFTQKHLAKTCGL